MQTGAVLVGLAFLLGGVQCGQSGAAQDAETRRTPIQLPDTVDLAYRDTLMLPADGDWLSFDSLVHDSRCPTGATCVWEGNAEVHLALRQDGQLHRVVLNAHPSFPMDSTLAGLTMAFIDLTPYPHIDSSYASDRYTLRLFLTR